MLPFSFMPNYSKPNPNVLPEDSGLLKELLSRIQTPDTSDIAGLMGPLGAPLAMTRYANKAAREAAFNQVWPTAIRNAKGDTKSAIEFLASKYPRIMSHVTAFFPNFPLEGFSGIQRARAPHGSDAYFSKIALNPNEIKATKGHPVKTLSHEVRHAVDQLRLGPKFQDLYEKSVDDFGYFDSPYEQVARKAGDTQFTRYIKQKALTRLAGKPNATPKR